MFLFLSAEQSPVNQIEMSGKLQCRCYTWFRISAVSHEEWGSEFRVSFVNTVKTGFTFVPPNVFNLKRSMKPQTYCKHEEWCLLGCYAVWLL
jgi:hypothetical protein